MRDLATAYQDMSTMVAAKQEPLEKVEVYIARVFRLALKASASEEQILFSIINGLRGHIRQHVLTQNCRTVEDIRRCSLIAEMASPDTADTATLLRRLEAKFDALSAQPSLPIPIPLRPAQAYPQRYSQPFVSPAFLPNNNWRPQTAGYHPNFSPQYQQSGHNQSGESNLNSNTEL